MTALVDATRTGAAVPDRQEIVLVGLATVLVTLVGQGLTLGPLVRRLGVDSHADPTAEVAQLRRRAADLCSTRCLHSPLGTAPPWLSGWIGAAQGERDRVAVVLRARSLGEVLQDVEAKAKRDLS